MKSKEIVDLSRPILVSMESFQTLSDAKCISDDGTRWHITLMAFDKDSRNNNIYPADDTKRSFKESTYINENLPNRTLFGEAEHPPADASLQRFLFVEPTRYAWNIQSIEDKGDRFEGDIQFCKPLGLDIILPNMQQLGSNYAASCRIYTPNFIKRNEGGKTYYIKKYAMYPITFDCVSMPGFKSCRIMDADSYRGNESASPAIKDVVFNNPAESIQEMLKSSEGMRVLSDYVNQDLSKIQPLVGKDRVRYTTNDGISLDVPLDRHMLWKVMH